MLGHYGIDCDPADLGIDAPRRSAVPSHGPSGPATWCGDPATVVHVGASHEARRWPVGRFASLVAALAVDGHRIVLTGSADERHRAQAVADEAGLPARSVWAGVLNLESLCATVAAARVVVSGDTGVAHLATAFATPSVVLFGPVSPAFWGPPRRSIHRVLWTGRTGSPHSHRVSRGLLEISVDDARRAVARVVCLAEAEPVRRS